MKVRTTTSATSKGFTLLELLVVIFIMVLAGSVLTVGLSSVTWARLSTQSRRLVFMVRYLYEKAVLTNHVYALVIDMDTGKYWGEVQPSTDPCQQYLIKKEEAPQEEDNEERQKEEEEDQENTTKKSSFHRSKDILLKVTQLPKGIKFAGVLVEHFEGPVESGKVKIHVFPNGYVEHAFIYLSKGEDEFYTVETLPLQGTAKVFKERLDEAEFERPQ